MPLLILARRSCSPHLSRGTACQVGIGQLSLRDMAVWADNASERDGMMVRFMRECTAELTQQSW